MKLRIEFDTPCNSRVSFAANGGGYTSVSHLQQEAFRRNTGTGIDNRLVRNIQNGVEVYEFTCSNFGYRDYDHGDYMIRSITKLTLE